MEEILFCATVEKNKASELYLEKLKKGVSSMFLNSKTVVKDIGKDKLIIMVLDLNIIPLYWIGVLAAVVNLFFPSAWWVAIACIFLVLSVPFIDSFWYMLFKLGIKKWGYEGKVKYISPSKAWRLHIGTN
jgi:hypothetical protein